MSSETPQQKHDNSSNQKNNNNNNMSDVNNIDQNNYVSYIYLKLFFLYIVTFEHIYWF